MKNTITFLFQRHFILLIIGLFFTLISCQKESIEEIYSTKETIIKSSPLTSLVKRVVMNNTSQDNIIDNTSCFMLKFPYSVTVNGSQININSATDYQLVQNNINAYTTDDDIVHITFGVTAILKNYTERFLTNQTAFNNLITECQSTANDFGKINCITILYPFSISYYNSNNQVASSVSVSNNKDLHEFLENLLENQFIAIVYPLNIINQNGQPISVTSNNQFEEVINSALENCAQNPQPTQTITQVVTSGIWVISYYYHSGNKTNIYNGYNFVFNTNLSATATKNGVLTNGNWKYFLDGSQKRFEIKFNPNPLNEIDEDWKVYEFSTTQISLKKSETNLETDYLYLQKL